MIPSTSSAMPGSRGSPCGLWLGPALTIATLAACDSSPLLPPPPPPVPVASVLVAPGEISLIAGQTRQLTATPLSATGQALPDRSVQWETSNATIATITSSGLVTAIARGAATVTATSGGHSGQALVTVEQPVARVVVSFDSLRMLPGESRPLLAGALDVADHPIPDLPVNWTSSAPQIASVDAGGLVTAIAAGSATVTARIDTASATVAVEVTKPMDVAGIWDWTETIVDFQRNPLCSDTGSYVFHQAGSVLSGSAAQVGTCLIRGRPQPNNSTALLNSGVIGATTVTFIVDSFPGTCHYTGTVDAPTATRITGTAVCGTNTGTWEAVRQTTIGGVRIVPRAVSLFRGETQSLAIELTNTAGHRVFYRPVTWSSGDDAVASVTADGVVHGTGTGTSQITATVEGVRGSAAVTIQTLNLTAVAAGGWSCGLTTGGETWCWGSEPMLLPAAPAFTSLTVGARTACGLTADGSAYCWNGGLGVGGWSETPVAVSGGVQFTSLAAGGGVVDISSDADIQTHICGLIVGGAAYCWGANSSGQLGTGTESDNARPQAVSGGVSFATLGAGGNYTCGLTFWGTAYCWGDNGLGQLGNGLPSRSVNVPTAVSGGLTFKTIAAGSWHTCALTTSGTAYCWGWNNGGQLGNGSHANSAVPVAVAGGLSFVSIVTGAWHSCALTAAGQAYCWGSNSWGNLGAGPGGDALSPVPVSGGLTFATLATGPWASHTCGSTTSGLVYCWGHPYGLGAGDIDLSDHPVRVLGQP
jgi:uncharacterized protein YjdB